MHDSKQEEILNQKIEILNEAATQLEANQTQEEEYRAILKEIGELETCPVTQYDTIEQAYNHRNTVESLQKELISKNEEQNPYDDQIEELKNTALQVINWDVVNELTKIKDHQDFLYKLLTSKDSFVRKKIIDQNLAFLNQRLTHYLDKIGLPHIVEFQNDLSVIITQLGQDLDFDNLSRGERNRLILSMSWAFRDVWENLYHPINLLFIDELVDSGMDASGVESSIALLKKMTRERDKNVFLISHRDDLTSRVNHVLRVIKEGGFTSYSNDVEIVR
jgi:DNA repair exonuclease SbcCD ATPase subunit